MEEHAHDDAETPAAAADAVATEADPGDEASTDTPPSDTDRTEAGSADEESDAEVSESGAIGSDIVEEDAPETTDEDAGSKAAARETSPESADEAHADAGAAEFVAENDDRSESDVDEPESPDASEPDAPVVIASAVDEEAAPVSGPGTLSGKDTAAAAVAIDAITKEFGLTRAVADVTLHIPGGSFYGLVGPNGAGKTTLLSMITGLLRPDSGRIQVNGHDVWADPDAAKRVLGVLPDRLRLFDRLTGSQFLYYCGTLRGLDKATVRSRSAELASAFGLEDALGRLVIDYSAGMTKKVALAAAMIHSPRILVLDEPFEGVDPVSAQTVIEILQRFVQGGGTVLLSSHSMETIERVCTGVAIIVHGELLVQGTVDEVSADGSLEERFLQLAGAESPAESMEWLLSSSG